MIKENSISFSSGITIFPCFIRLSILPNLSDDGDFSQQTWKVGLFERCCDCTGFCWFAWCCGCFPLAQIAGRMRSDAASDMFGHLLRVDKFNFVITVFGILWFVQPSGVLHPFSMYFFAVLFFARVAVRERYRISGSYITGTFFQPISSRIVHLKYSNQFPSSSLSPFLSDCLSSFFCSTCTLIQIANQIWSNPTRVPAVAWTDKPCHVEEGFAQLRPHAHDRDRPQQQQSVDELVIELNAVRAEASAPTQVAAASAQMPAYAPGYVPLQAHGVDAKGPSLL